MYETPEIETDVLVRSSAIRIHTPEDFEDMRKAGRLVAGDGKGADLAGGAQVPERAQELLAPDLLGGDPVQREELAQRY